MKNEDLDWIIYHILIDKGAKTEESLVRETGLPAGDINASLIRLKSGLLIDFRNGFYDVISVPEMLFLCHCRHGENSPVVIEDGVIKVKKPEQ